MKQPFKVVIPARYASTRLPGKPLIDLAGRSMLEHVWRQAMASSATEVVIATDDKRIKEAALSFGAEVKMTSADHESGTDRIAEVTRLASWQKDEVIVNVQADEPLIPVELIDQVALLLLSKPTCMMATLCEPLSTWSELSDPNQVKVVFDHESNALYFSRAPIPWIRERKALAGDLPEGFYRHIGIYAYQVGLLQEFTNWPMDKLEAIEKLEQLRILARGIKIAVTQACKPSPRGVDTAADLEYVRAELTKL